MISKSTNFGSNWIALNKLTTTGQIRRISVSPNGNFWIGGSKSNNLSGGQILFSSNNGVTWNVQLDIDKRITKIVMINNEIGFASSASNIYKTTTGGQNWNLVTSASSLNYIADMDFLDSNNGIYAGEGGMFLTTNGGLSWAIMNRPASAIYLIDFTDLQNGWCADGLDNLYQTTNGGQNWNSIFAVSNGIDVLKKVSSTSGYIVSQNGLARTINSGANWTSVPTPPGVNAMDWLDINNGIIAGGSGFTAITSDGGSSWNVLNCHGVNNVFGQVIMKNSSTYYLAQGGLYGSNVFKFSNIITSANISQDLIPDKYYLLQNFPNPFNPKTLIQFSIPERTKVILKIFDINGREISVLEDETLSVGEYTYEFNAEKLPSGVYFFKIVTEEFSKTKKMILLK